MLSLFAMRPVVSLPIFIVGQILNPYTSHYTESFAFYHFLYPLGDSAFLTVGLLGFLDFPRPHWAYSVVSMNLLASWLG